ncbi:Ctr copper transporter [Moelleriella libera RCEF 2490]|uniref:Copper transport protein n=1 Tax=Moelleriella libera RCEF 2490 TaxID=1081109 RepID=A0A167XKC1_9HYPO|nr:Ctr copper transporter [Moelleriella libera RCEF 2490]
MPMPMGTATTTGMTSAATGAPAMGHGMGPSDCKISGMFAGSCIGVFFLTMALEFLRRSIKEYDRFLIHQHMTHFASLSAPVAGAAARSASVSSKDGITPAARRVPPFRPNVWQQAIRAFLHMTAFFVGYILMLLAMYYNGYILLCIFLGAYFGAFVFQWETLTPSGSTSAAQETTGEAYWDAVMRMNVWMIETLGETSFTFVA